MAFEVYPYDRACVPSTQPLGLTLNTHGQMLVNAATCAALGRPSHVRLLYDRATRTIGIQASGDGEPHALRVSSPHGEPRSRRVSAKGFCTYFGLQPYQGRWYRGELRDGMLHVALGDQQDRDGAENRTVQATGVPRGACPCGRVPSAVPPRDAMRRQAAPQRDIHRRPRHGASNRGSL